jgi:hypothetical protein
MMAWYDITKREMIKVLYDEISPHYFQHMKVLKTETQKTSLRLCLACQFVKLVKSSSKNICGVLTNHYCPNIQ